MKDHYPIARDVTAEASRHRPRQHEGEQQESKERQVEGESRAARFTGALCHPAGERI
jgi:hypothetical protein